MVPSTESEQRHSRSGRFAPVLLGAAGGAALSAVLVLGVAGFRANSGATPAAAKAFSQSLGAYAGSAAPSGGVADIYQRVRPAVVEIQVRSSRGSGLGTGVVISDKGEILTNAHVVAGARNVQVKLSDGTTLPGQVQGVQQADDLAIVKANIPQDKLNVVKIGDSSKLRAGQQVIAIGNPFGLEGSVTQGIVSGLRNASADGSSDAIQIDAAINPGNSGGPLLDMDGNLIGINEALENPTGQNVFVGVGFAIPINTAKADLNQLRTGGSSGGFSRNSP